MEGLGHVPNHFNTVGSSEIESMFYENKLAFFKIFSYKIWAVISSLTINLGITKYKAEQYLSLLENAFLVQRFFVAGTIVMKEPKVLMTPPVRLLYRESADSIGFIRKDFAVFMLKSAVEEMYYLKASRGEKDSRFHDLAPG